MVNSHEGKKPSTTWTRPSGRPRRTWLNHIQDADARPLSTTWRSEVARGHGGAQRSIRTSRWWWLQQTRETAHTLVRPVFLCACSVKIGWIRLSTNPYYDVCSAQHKYKQTKIVLNLQLLQY